MQYIRLLPSAWVNLRGVPHILRCQPRVRNSVAEPLSGQDREDPIKGFGCRLRPIDDRLVDRAVVNNSERSKGFGICIEASWIQPGISLRHAHVFFD